MTDMSKKRGRRTSLAGVGALGFAAAANGGCGRSLLTSRSISAEEKRRMPSERWKSYAATVFECEKRPAIGHRGMVVTNHPLASAAGAEILAAGGNAIFEASGEHRGDKHGSLHLPW